MPDKPYLFHHVPSVCVRVLFSLSLFVCLFANMSSEGSDSSSMMRLVMDIADSMTGIADHNERFKAALQIKCT
jgi:hypothetical protein